MGVEQDRILLVYNKVDRPHSAVLDRDGIPVSAVTGDGLDRLREAVIVRLETLGVPVPFYGRGMA